MHSIGIHSALAIKRQRKRRDDQKKARERRYSTQSSDSGDVYSPHGSTRRKWRHQPNAQQTGMSDSKVVTSVGMLHIGVVFLVFGIFLLGAGIVPSDISRWSSFVENASWWNELICTGLFAIGLGVFLIVLNCVISKREEDDLEKYVQSQLTRSRSGHRLERDVETGVLTTKHGRRMGNVAKEQSGDNLSQSNATPVTSELVTPTTPAGVSGEMLLEKILEEDSSYGDERNQCISPLGVNEKKLLLGNGHTNSVHITRI